MEIFFIFISFAILSYVFNSSKGNQKIHKFLLYFIPTLLFNIFSFVVVYIAPVISFDYKPSILKSFGLHLFCILLPYLIYLIGYFCIVEKNHSILSLKDMNFIYLATVFTAILSFFIFAWRSSGGRIKEPQEATDSLYQYLFAPVSLLISEIIPLNTMYSTNSESETSDSETSNLRFLLNHLIEIIHIIKDNTDNYITNNGPVIIITAIINLLIGLSLIFSEKFFEILNLPIFIAILLGIAIPPLCISIKESIKNRH